MSCKTAAYGIDIGTCVRRYVTVDARKYITIYVEKYYGSNFVGICLGQDGDNRKQGKCQNVGFPIFIAKEDHSLGSLDPPSRSRWV
jgi:hypothetical protein